MWVFSASATGSLSVTSAQSARSGDADQQPWDRPMTASPLPTPTSTPSPSPPAAPLPPPEAPAAPVVEAAPEPVPAPVLRSPTAEEAAVASQVIAIVNQRRAEAGCGPVSEDAPQAALAFTHSADMAMRNYFSHYTPEGLSPVDRSVAVGLSTGWENIGAGMPTAESAMEAWMGSQGHRDNILMCSHTKLGVGVFQGAGDYGIYWTQLFG